MDAINSDQFIFVIDTTDGINFKFVQNINDKMNLLVDHNMTAPNPGSILHQQIDSELKKVNKKFSEMTHMIWAAGPGSYTGLRISHGFHEILKWNNVVSKNYYHFQLLETLTRPLQKCFLMKAFKGEYIIFLMDSPLAKAFEFQPISFHQHLQQQFLWTKKLVAVNQLNHFLISLQKYEPELIFYSSWNVERNFSYEVEGLNNFAIKNVSDPLNVSLDTKIKFCFEKNEIEELYYFRSVEDEFRQNAK